MSDNNWIFDIPNIRNCMCQLSKYQLGHSYLSVIIRFPNSNTTKIITFTDVRYIQASVSWVGAEFTAKSPEKSLKFAKSIGIGSISEGDYTLYETRINNRRRISSNRLYQSIVDIFLKLISVFNTNYQNRIVRILAHSVTLRDEK